LSIELSNTGNLDATNIVGVLSSTDADVNTTINPSESNYPDIESNSVGNSILNYSFTAPTDGIYHGRVIPFDLNITSNEEPYTFVEDFFVNIINSQLEVGNRSVLVDGEETNTFDIGDSVELFVGIENYGTITANTVSAVLSLSSDLPSDIVSITNSFEVYGNIESFETITNSNPFTFYIENTYSGEELIFNLSITDFFGYTVEYELNLSESFPPLINDFSFISDRNSITLLWRNAEWDPDIGPNGSWVDFDNIKGNNIYRSTDEYGTYTKINDYLVTGSSLYFDSDMENELEEYWYKISVVSDTGNELPLEDLITNDGEQNNGYLAWTTLNRHDGFPIQAHIDAASSALSSPTVHDIDGSNTKEIFVNYKNNGGDDGEGRVMGFYHTGQEVFNIEGTPTDIWGFAATSERVDLAKPAIGDIDGDGNAEVICTGRNNSTNTGILYGFHTIDEDPIDGHPDILFEIDLGHRAYRNPVLADITNDNSLEIIISDESPRIHIYNNDGSLLGSSQIIGEDYSLGEVAVGDIDNDGFKEIIVGIKLNSNNKGAIYMWDHDGDFDNSPIPIKVFGQDEKADNGVVLADIDNDGKLEILTITNTGNVYALEMDGLSAEGNWNTLSIPSENMPRIAIGDLNSDGLLEVVFGSLNTLYILNNLGDVLQEITIENSGDTAPTLADIDSDDDIEIVINSDGDIYAYNYDGSMCVGWPLQSENNSKFVGSPFIGDIDNLIDNGYSHSEVVISSEDCSTYVWNTDGDANRVEWGSYRHDAQNTGTYINECKFKESASIEINNPNTVWNTAKHIQGNLIIKANADLTIQAVVTFVNGSKLTIEPGAKLVIDGAKLTNSCGGHWEGIQVLGNKNLLQTESNQGLVEVINGGVIENAEIAIYAGNKDNETGSENGGIVKIDNAEFIDNIWGVYIPQYRTDENQSYIKNSTFKTTPNYLYEASPHAFITLWDVGTIDIEGNTFENENVFGNNNSPIFKQGVGVKTTDADFNIVPFGVTPNQFINLYKGVDIQGTMDSSSNIISDNTFTGNVIGVYLNSANSTSVTSNEMDLYSTFDFNGNYKPTGLYVTGSQGLHIEANEIFDSSTLKPNLTVGMFVRDLGSTYDEIYRNYFTDLDTGVFSEGINGGISFLSGLKIICNEFDEVSHDIYVAPLSQIGMIQGSKYETAGNIFTPECSGTYDEFDNNGGQITYYYQNSPEYIPDCNYNVNLFESEVPHDCISRLPAISGFDGAIAGLNSSITMTESALATLIDGGDTEGLNETVEEAESSEALQLRNELLSNSPMLSDTVMVNTTVVEDVLPSLMVKEVLAANPQAAKSDKVQTALDERINQLPTYMRSEIDLGKNSLSDKETLESQLALAINQREDLINRKMMQLKQDATTEALDTLETLLVTEAASKLDRTYQLIDFYLSQGDVQNAQTLFIDIPTNFDLTSSEQSKYDKLAQLYTIRFSLENSNKSWFEMDSIQKNLVESIAIDSISTAGMQSRAILSLVDNIDYGCYIPDIVVTPKSANTNENTEETFKVFPEQATDYFIVEYVLAEDEILEEIAIVVFNNTGKQVKELDVKTRANQFLIICEDWQEGTYWCRKLVDKSVVSEQKVIINRNSQVLETPNAIQGANSLVLFPNPTSGYFFVSYGTGITDIDTLIQITDTKGTLLGQYPLVNGQNKIDTYSWQKGIYLVSILQNNKLLDTAKIVVE